MLLFLALPILALLLRVQFPSIGGHLLQPTVQQAIRLSAVTSFTTLALTLVFGTPLAYWLGRKRFRGHSAVDTLVDLPMVLPPSVAGIALLMAFGRRGLIGSGLNEVGLSLAFTQMAVILAQLFVSAPFYIKAASGAFASVDNDLEQAAALDGANWWRIFQHVTLPLTSSALLGGAMMSWARALGEFGATIIFAGNFPGRTQTMPLAIYLGFELNLNVALTLSAILLAISFTVLLLVKVALRQRVSVSAGSGV
jgi:molybdate transport system permease protein